MNVWERAKEAVATAKILTERIEYKRTHEHFAALLAEMERVECVEGGERNDGNTTYFYTDPGCGGNRALLLLLPEEEL